MMYYPLMQAFCRLGACIYEPIYGFGDYPGHTSSIQFALSCWVSLTAPSSGIGYLIIFLIMQPNAYRLLVSWLTCSPILSSLAESEESQGSSYYNNKSKVAVSLRESMIVKMRQISMMPDNELMEIVDNPILIAQLQLQNKQFENGDSYGSSIIGSYRRDLFARE
jgi:hypothetical protein